MHWRVFLFFMNEATPQNQKSQRALQEEAILEFWKQNTIFQKSVEKNKNGKEFIFYEGPPTANAKPALHHLEARAFKDVIPRYKTMQGYHVPRRAGWDTHGLPVELQIEKELGLQSKKDIEQYGIAAFNKACKESVFTHIRDWERFTDRMGYWVDKESAYYTFNASYMESLWNIVSEVNKKGLLYKDYKVIPWCSRCGTGLSSHELAQGYQDVKELSVYAKFRLSTEQFSQSSNFDTRMSPDTLTLLSASPSYLLAWTTTPWTLPGNVALAVGKDIDYVVVKVGEENVVVAKEKLSLIGGDFVIVAELKGVDLVGLSYEPLYPYLKTEAEKKGVAVTNAFKVYPADFVTTTDGTGIVHIAPMYGADDFELGTTMGLPKFHTVDEQGHFIKGTDFLEGRFVKDEAVAVDIIKDLAGRGQLFKKEKYEHTYPHCWRCKTPLLYYARDSWYIRMSSLRSELLKANEGINWEPEHIKEGRFGEWLREVKDWAISRERYWGTPLPLWTNDRGDLLVVDSVATLRKYTKRSGNHYTVIRHAQAQHNLTETWSCTPGVNDVLTPEGESQARAAASQLKGTIDLIVASPFIRSKETARLIAEELGIDPSTIIIDERVGEWNVSPSHNGKPMQEYFDLRAQASDRYRFKLADGESYQDVFTRTGAFLYECEETYQNKSILVVTHGGSARAMELVARGFAYDTLFETTRDYRNFENAEIRTIDFVPLPHNDLFELDLHRPYIDAVVLEKEGSQYHRVKEVMDVWFDSGAMPFAQDHYPFENKEWIDTNGYPADFISEAIDQTRGWFYTLLSVGVLMERGTPYKNVICLGHLLDKEGKKMSKSLGNVIEPFDQMDRFGADAVRFWMYSVNAPGEGKNYDEKNIVEINNKVFNLIGNVLSFYELYRDHTSETVPPKEANILDRWIMTRLDQLIAETTENLDSFDLFKPTRAIRDFVDDLSTWYLRRSRDRIKEGDSAAQQTLASVLKVLAQVIAPFAPFTAEVVWQKLKHESDEESVHLSAWPKSKHVDETLIENMVIVRELCAIGNYQRKQANIPVRQPLQSFTIQQTDGAFGKVNEQVYTDLIRDELNVEKIIFGDETKIDQTITEELKKKGDYRELVRAVQELRKEKGLAPRDLVTLTLSLKAQPLLSPFLDDFKKTVGANEVLFADNEGSVLFDEITGILYP